MGWAFSRWRTSSKQTSFTKNKGRELTTWSSTKMINWTKTWVTKGTTRVTVTRTTSILNKMIIKWTSLVRAKITNHFAVSLTIFIFEEETHNKNVLDEGVGSTNKASRIKTPVSDYTSMCQRATMMCLISSLSRVMEGSPPATIRLSTTLMIKFLTSTKMILFCTKLSKLHLGIFMENLSQSRNTHRLPKRMKGNLRIRVWSKVSPSIPWPDRTHSRIWFSSSSKVGMMINWNQPTLKMRGRSSWNSGREGRKTTMPSMSTWI